MAESIVVEAQPSLAPLPVTPNNDPLPPLQDDDVWDDNDDDWDDDNDDDGDNDDGDDWDNDDDDADWDD